MKVVLYTTHCPQCTVLENMLKANNVEYDVETDVKLMRQKKFFSVPKLEVDGVVMDMKQSMEWLKENFN